MLFFLGIPALVCVLYFLPFLHYALLVALILLVQYCSSREMRRLMPKAGLSDPGNALTVVGLFQSLLIYLACVLNSDPGTALKYLLFIATCSICILLAPLAFKHKEQFPNVFALAASKSLSFFYVALLPSLLVVIVAGFPEAKNAILSFVLLTYGNDSLAWLFGKYLGKRRNIVDASPNKSIAGFVGGTAGSLIAGFISFDSLHALPGIALAQKIVLSSALGLGMAFFVIVGDLFESALKRSASVKDSGTMVPGRGGVLDSFDSLFFSAPYFIAFSFIFHLFSL